MEDLTKKEQNDQFQQVFKQFFERKDIYLLYQEYYKVLINFEQVPSVVIDSLFTSEITIAPRLKHEIQVNQIYSQFISYLMDAQIPQKDNIKQLYQQTQRKFTDEQYIQTYKQMYKIEKQLDFDFVGILDFAANQVSMQFKAMNQFQTIELISNRYVQYCDNNEEISELLKYCVQNSRWCQVQLFINSFSKYLNRSNNPFGFQQKQPKLQTQLQRILLMLLFYLEADKGYIITNILLQCNLQQFDYTMIRQILTQLQPLHVNVLYNLQSYILNNRVIKSSFVCPMPQLTIPICVQPRKNEILPSVQQLCFKLFTQGEIIMSQDQFDIDKFIVDAQVTLDIINQSSIETKQFLKKFNYKNIFDKQKSQQTKQLLNQLKQKSNSELQTFYIEYFCFLAQCKQKLRNNLIKQQEHSTSSDIQQKLKQLRDNQLSLKDKQEKKEEKTRQFNQAQINQQKQTLYAEVSAIQENINKINISIKEIENGLMSTIFNQNNIDSKAEKLVQDQLSQYYVLQEKEIQALADSFFQISSVIKIMNNHTLNRQIIQVKYKDNKFIYVNHNNHIISQQNEDIIGEYQTYDNNTHYFISNIYPSKLPSNRYLSPLFDSTLECLNILLKQLQQKQNMPYQKVHDQIKAQYRHQFQQAVQYYFDYLNQSNNQGQQYTLSVITATSIHQFIAENQQPNLKILLEYYCNLLENISHQYKIEQKFTQPLKLNQFDKIDYDLMMLREEQMKKPLQQNQHGNNNQQQQPQQQSLIKQQIDKLEQIRINVGMLMQKYGNRWYQYMQPPQEQQNFQVKTEMCKKPVQEILALTGFSESVLTGMKQYCNIDIQGDQTSYIQLLNKIIESAGIYAYMSPENYGELLLKQVVLNRKFGNKLIENRQQQQQQNKAEIKLKQPNSQPYAIQLTDPCATAPIYDVKMKLNHLGVYLAQLLQVSVQSYTTTAAAPGLDYYFFSQDSQIPELGLQKINDLVKDYNKILSQYVHISCQEEDSSKQNQQDSSINQSQISVLTTQQITQLLNSECSIIHWKIKDLVVFIAFLILQQRYQVAEKLIQFALQKVILTPCQNDEIMMLLCLNYCYKQLQQFSKSKEKKQKRTAEKDDIQAFSQNVDQRIKSFDIQKQDLLLTLESIKMCFITVLLHQIQSQQSNIAITNIFQQNVIHIADLIFQTFKDPQLALNILPQCNSAQYMEDQLNVLAGNFDKVKQRDNFNGILIRDALNMMLITNDDNKNN